MGGTTIQMLCSSNMYCKESWDKTVIQPSKAGNCTRFEDSLMQVGGLVSFSSKRQMADPVFETSDQNAILAEHMLLLNDINNPHPLKDNILYYTAGYIV